jgi:hypothetical protein
MNKCQECGEWFSNACPEIEFKKHVMHHNPPKDVSITDRIWGGVAAAKQYNPRGIQACSKAELEAFARKQAEGMQQTPYGQYSGLCGIWDFGIK